MPYLDGNMQIRCVITGSTVPGGGVNVWHMQKNGAAANLVEAQAVVDALRDFYTAIADRYPIATQVVVGQQVLNLGVTPHELVPVIPRTVAGTAASTEALPTQTTLTLRLRSLIASRSGRGRIFLGPFTEADNTVGAPAAALVADVNAAVASALGPLLQPADNVRGLAINSRTLTDFIPVVAATTSTTWSVLRSRR